MIKIFLTILSLSLLISSVRAETILEFSSFVESEDAREFIPKKILNLDKGKRYSEGSDLSYPIKIYISKQRIYLHDEQGNLTFAIEKNLLSQNRGWVFNGYVFTAKKVGRFLGFEDVYLIYRKSTGVEVKESADVKFYFDKESGLIGLEIASIDGSSIYPYWLNSENGFGCSKEDCVANQTDNDFLLSVQQVSCLKGKISDEFDRARCLYKGRQLDQVITELKKEEKRKKVCSDKSYKPEIYEDLCK